MLLGAGPRLGPHVRRLDLDAVEGRQAYDVLNDIIPMRTQHKVQPDVLIHVGDNGIISPTNSTTPCTRSAAPTRVVLMTVRVPREWQDPNNSTIRSVGKRFDNVEMVDWHALAGAHHVALLRRHAPHGRRAARVHAHRDDRAALNAW